MYLAKVALGTIVTLVAAGLGGYFFYYKDQAGGGSVEAFLAVGLLCFLLSAAILHFVEELGYLVLAIVAAAVLVLVGLVWVHS